jgi:hypothetical protein
MKRCSDRTHTWDSEITPGKACKCGKILAPIPVMVYQPVYVPTYLPYYNPYPYYVPYTAPVPYVIPTWGTTTSPNTFTVTAGAYATSASGSLTANVADSFSIGYTSNDITV